MLANGEKSEYQLHVYICGVETLTATGNVLDYLYEFDGKTTSIEEEFLRNQFRMNPKVQKCDIVGFTLYED